MYTKLNRIIKELGITKKYLSKEVLKFNGQQSLSNRLSGIVDFSEQEKKSIYDYLCSQGYEGSIEELFSEDSNDKQESRFSRILREEMKKKKMTIEALQERLEFEENIKVSTVTISNWRNGKISGYPKHEICKAICKILDISIDYFYSDGEIYQYEGNIMDQYYENNGFKDTHVFPTPWRQRSGSIEKIMIDFLIKDDEDLGKYEAAMKNYRIYKIVHEVAHNMLLQFAVFLTKAMYESDELITPFNEEVRVNDYEHIYYSYVDKNGIPGEEALYMDTDDLDHYMNDFERVIDNEYKGDPITLKGYEWGIASYLHLQRERLKSELDSLKGEKNNEKD